MVEYLLSLEEALNSVPGPQYIYRKQGNQMTEQGISRNTEKNAGGFVYIFNIWFCYSVYVFVEKFYFLYSSYISIILM